MLFYKHCKHIYLPHKFSHCINTASGTTRYAYQLQCIKCGKIPLFKIGTYRDKQSLFDYNLYNVTFSSFGASGFGKCHHPWDDLNPCPCGCKERPLLMYEGDTLYYCGGPIDKIYAICSICGRHTAISNIVTVINDWNTGNIKGSTLNKSSGMQLSNMSRRQFLLYKMAKANSFDLSEKEISEYFKLLSRYIEEHEYVTYLNMKENPLIEALSERQQICSRNAIQCLFNQDFLQALHETLNVLSDYNKETPLTYNEYVLLSNILITYNHLTTR